ncbi:MAG TPA: cytochrome C oxidase subunit IV family protein [Pirellulales bacterium]|nr:cytochrome C oxidase subunit IV family protein [Pirellulales bacterium]
MTDHGHTSGGSHGHGLPHAHGSAHDGHDHGGIAKYIYVFIALCVLTGCSFFTYSSAWPFHHKPEIGWAFMMAVSCTKALLVILFFMHVKYEANWKYVLTIPAACMSIFLVCALVPDVGLRNRSASQEALSYMAAPEDNAQGSAQDLEQENEPKHH